MLGFGDLLSPVLHCKQMFAAMVWTSGNQSYIKQTTCGQAPSQWQDSSRNSNCGAIIILHYNLKVKDIRIPTWNFLKNHFIMLFGVSGVCECMNCSRVRSTLAYSRLKDYVPLPLLSPQGSGWAKSRSVGWVGGRALDVSGITGLSGVLVLRNVFVTNQMWYLQTFQDVQF